VSVLTFLLARAAAVAGVVGTTHASEEALLTAFVVVAAVFVAGATVVV